jgi:hypothetical protein
MLLDEAKREDRIARRLIQPPLEIAHGLLMRLAMRSLATRSTVSFSPMVMTGACASSLEQRKCGFR